MNRIVLIGNGFDLAHGLKTSYQDFINWYWKQWKRELILCHCSILEDPLCSLELDTEETDFTQWHGFLMQNSIAFQQMSGMEFYEAFSDSGLAIMKKSVLLTRICRSIETKGWVDIEADYYELLKDLINKKSKKEIVELHIQFGYLQEKLIDYLREKKNITISKNYNIQSIIEQSINKKDISVQALNTIFHTPEYFHDIPLSSTLLLTFNYTYTAEEYAQVPNITVNHIHGMIYQSKSIIFGYGDELDKHYKELEELNDNEYLKNVKSIRYLESDNYRKLLEFIETAPYQIYIMGHSCGNSDRTLLNTLFEHKNCVSIKPFYYVKDDGTDNYTELAQNISRNFKDKQALRDKVVNKEFCEPLPQTSTN